MVEFIEVTTEPWEERLFDCEVTEKGRRKLREISRRYTGDAEGFRDDFITIDDSETIYDIEVIGSGQTRVVARIPDDWHTGGSSCIAKLKWAPKSGQTFREIQIWTNANGRQAALLAPLLDWDDATGRWLLMPEAKMHRQLTFKQVKEIRDYLNNKLREVGFRTFDVRTDNIGRIEGRDVLIDYGQLRE